MTLAARLATWASSCCGVRNDGGHGKRGRHCVVVEADLVRWDDHGAARDVDADRESNFGESPHLSDQGVIELAANVVVNRHCDGYLGVGKQLTLLGSEHKRDALVVGKEELLVLLESLRLSESVARD